MSKNRGWITTSCKSLPHPVAANDSGGGGWEFWDGKAWGADPKITCIAADGQLAKKSSVRFERVLSDWSLLKKRWSEKNIHEVIGRAIFLTGHTLSDKTNLMGEYVPEGSFNGEPKFRFQGTYNGCVSIYMYRSSVEGKWIVGAEDDMERSRGWIKSSQASLPHPFAASEISGGGWEFWQESGWKADRNMRCVARHDNGSSEASVASADALKDSNASNEAANFVPGVLNESEYGITHGWVNALQVEYVDVYGDEVSPM